MVRDTDNGDDEDSAGKQSKKKKREFSRLKKRTADVTLEEEDLLLIEDNLRAEYDGKGLSSLMQTTSEYFFLLQICFICITFIVCTWLANID